MNSSSVGVARWRELIDAFRVQRERLVAVSDGLYEMSEPNPGASEEQLAAAEQRLGYEIPAQYREFLTVANGWRDWNQDTGLLSCDEIGHGTISESEGLGIRLAEGDVLVSWESDADWVRIADSDGTYWETFMLHRDSQGYRSGQLMMTPHGGKFYDSFEEYLVEELAALTEFIDGEALGPHGKYWGRDLRLDPPTMQEIVDRLYAKRIEYANVRGEQPPQAPNPRAGASDIAAVESHLGHPLHPEHRELLMVMNGWPGNPHILSTTEITSGEAWAAALRERDRHNDWQAADFARVGISSWEKPEPAAVVADRATVTPLFTQVLMAYGVDVDDGIVREIEDRRYAVVEPVGSGIVPRGTVREFLLSEIDGVCQQIDAWRRTFG